jgi:hypothetical protein
MSADPALDKWMVLVNGTKDVIHTDNFPVVTYHGGDYEESYHVGCDAV